MARLPRPTTRRGALLAIAGVLIAAGAIGFVIVYFLLFPTSSPKPFALTTPTSGATTATPPSPTASFAGSWKIAPGSVAGYRVREKLAFLPAQSDAVGRTSAITGTAGLTQQGRTVTIQTASFNVDVTTLKSDQSMRDEHIRTLGLESDQYPTATFKLTSPVTLPSTALSGSVVHVPVTGVFNIHGTSRTETIPVAMQLSSAGIQAVGSLTFPWAAFGMTAPSVGGFVSVTDHATMEFDLRLARA